MKTKKLLSILTILLCCTFAYAQPGSLDLSFNPGTGANDIVYTTSIQSDGKIIIGGLFTSYNGTARNRIARLNADGSLDTSFNTGIGANNAVISTSIQDDGKIIIGGNFIFYNEKAINRIARLNTGGSLDTTFDPGTGANDFVWSTCIQNDGKIIIGGNFTSFNGMTTNHIARLNTNGSLDTTFNLGTGANGIVRTISIQNDSKIIIGGEFTSFNGTAINRIARLNSDGSLDNSFDPGKGANAIIMSSSIQKDNKIILGGGFTYYNGIERQCILRLNMDGSLDNSFYPGIGANDWVHSISIQGDGKIIIGGQFNDYNRTNRPNIARVNNDGSIDNSFDPESGPNNKVRTTSIQSDGKIIIGGDFSSFNYISRSRIARLTEYGTSVPNYNKNESRFNIFPNPFSSHTTLQSDHFINDGTLTIYNTLGEVVSQLTNINGQSVSINRGNLANGLYFIRLTEGKHEIMMKKVIVVD